MSEPVSEDKRVARTRAAVTQALMDLVAEVPYAEISVGDIIARAEVGRSTFYQHYAGKDEVLMAIMEGGFEALADTVSGGPHAVFLEDWLGIFWENRRAGRALLEGSTRRFISRNLTEAIVHRLKGDARLAPLRAEIPVGLLGAMIAEAQLGLIQAWLAGRDAARPSAMTKALGQMTQSLASYQI